jgi:protein required for attachment to host cells
MKKKPVWALVVNSERARILFDPLGPGDVGQDEQLVRSANENLRAALSKIGAAGADKGTIGRQADEYRLIHEAEDMESFAKQIGAALMVHLAEAKFGSLAIFASAPMLQKINLHFDPALRAIIVMEHVANIAHIDEVGLRKMVRQFLHKPG